MRVPVGPAGDARRDHRLAERLQRARDVHALAARHRGLLDGPMAASDAEVRHRQRLVDRCIERDGDDHPFPLLRRTATNTSRTMPSTIATIKRVPSDPDDLAEEAGALDFGERDERHAADRLAVALHLHPPDTLALRKRAVELVGRVQRPWWPSRRSRSTSVTGRAAPTRRVLVAIVHVQLGERLAPPHHALAAELLEPPPQQRERVRVARGLARRAERHRDHPAAAGGTGPDEHVAGTERVPGLHAADERVALHEQVAVVDRARPRAALERRHRQVDDPRELAVGRAAGARAAPGRARSSGCSGSSKPIGFA